jgi:hypothetical protein
MLEADVERDLSFGEGDLGGAMERIAFGLEDQVPGQRHGRATASFHFQDIAP